ncbi:hypothetical protein ACJJTC_011778 [Scirpophaga incertulas]
MFIKIILATLKPEKYILQIISNSARHSSYYKYKYSADVEAAVNKQIKSEKQAAEAYLDLATKFLHPKTSYVGVGGFFMKMYEEELDHMRQFINYQLIRGGIPHTNTSSNDHSITLLEAFNIALEMEKKVTEQLEGMVCIAESSHDSQCADFVTSKFLGHQMLSIQELAQFVTILKRLGDNKHGLHHFDIKLAKSYPYLLK